MESIKKLVLYIPIFAALTWSCTSPARIPPSEGLELPTEQLADGKLLFNNYCASCHPRGLSGVGPGIIDKPLPKFLIRFQIRHGLGVMPKFGEEIISDEDVKNIARYLDYLKDQDV